jgi:hypothetical protein
MRAIADDPWTDVVFGVAVKIFNANDVESFVFNADDEVTAVHVRDGGHIGYDVFALGSGNGVLEGFEFFPFARLVLNRVFSQEILS